MNHYDQYGNKIRVVNVLGNENQFTYDILGRLIIIKDALGRTTNNTYDDRDRIIKITYPNNSYEKYIYSPVGKRLAIERYDANEATPEDIRYFVYDALRCNNVYEFSTSTGIINRYIYINPGNELVAKISTLSANLLSLSYYHSDALGSVSMVTDGNGNGNVNNTYNYEPFGNILSSTGKGDAYKFIGTIYGVENDGMSGLYHMNNRYYDASTGRFISRDIVRGFVNDPLSLNRYVYCKNNPINFIDPEGLWSFTTDIGITILGNTYSVSFEGDTVSRQTTIDFSHSYDFTTLIGGGVGYSVNKSEVGNIARIGLGIHKYASVEIRFYSEGFSGVSATIGYAFGIPGVTVGLTEREEEKNKNCEGGKKE